MRADRVNLLPKNMRYNPATPQNILVVGWSLAIFVMVVSFSIQGYQYKSADSQVNELTGIAKATDSSIQEVTKAAVASTNLNQRITQSQQFLATKVSWTGALKELSLLIPKTVWISNFSMKSNESGPFIEIIGSAPSQNKISAFLNSLETSFYFRKVNLRKSEKVAAVLPDLYKFELEISVPQLMPTAPPVASISGGSSEKTR